MVNVDILLLRCFLVAQETGSFSAASRELHCSQAAMSVRVKKLEDQLGVQLFHREYHQLKLTDEGRQVLSYARRLLTLHEDMIESLQKPRVTGVVKVGIADDYADPLFSKVLRQFARSYPDVETEISCQLSCQLQERVLEGELDLAIVTLDECRKDTELLSSRALHWVGSDYFSKRGNNGLPLACYPEGCVFRARAANCLDKAGIPWRIAYSSASRSGIHAAVGAGLAVTVMAEGTIPSDLRIMDEEFQLPELGSGDIRLMQRAGSLPDVAELMKTALKQMY